MSEEHYGAWWAPDAPDVRVPGALRRTGDGWHLDLIGTLMVNVGGWDGLRLVPPHTVRGSCHGVSYTLMECYLDDDVQGPHQGSVDVAGDQWTMSWRVGQVVVGGEVAEATRFSVAQFEITGLSAWWAASGLRGPQVRPGTYIAPDDVVLNLDGETVITIGVRDSRSRGRRARTLRERVVVTVNSDPGLTLDDLEKEIAGPLRSLVAIGVNEPVRVFNLQVLPVGTPTTSTKPPKFLQVDPLPAWQEEEEPAPGLHAPLPLSPSFEEVPSFLPAWLRVARRCSVPLDAVEPRQRTGSLQLQLLDAVNAAETLHRALHDEPREHHFADRVRSALQETGGFNSSERREVHAAVKVFLGVTLEKRLLTLAEELGPEVCEWLFQGATGPWAFVTARIRNVLSHGFATTEEVHRDPGALVGSLRLTEAVITLRLLTEAGFSTGAELTTHLDRHWGLRSLAKQSIADWPALAHRINPQQWPDPRRIE
ncbi:MULTISPECIES: HEPN domain-containing protein [Streptomyces]|uniref:ApeA N-terminal domain 1-containing protein n=1 Tax=Streptomyces TaxID=1883 RepID=UPI00117E5553|nr:MULTISPECIES: HEPN domain-containing protein [unclassified Streptomyces]